MKKILMVMLVSMLFISCNVFAEENLENDAISYDESNVTVLRRASERVVNSNLNPGGVSWQQVFKRNTRIYIRNDSYEPVTVTLRKNGKFYSSFIAYGGSTTEDFNNTGVGYFSLDFSSSSGNLSGVVSVRISDNEF